MDTRAYTYYTHTHIRVKELRSNQGGGGGVAVTEAPKQPDVLPPKPVGQEPSSPVQTDLQYLHLSLQRVRGAVESLLEFLEFLGC